MIKTFQNVSIKRETIDSVLNMLEYFGSRAARTVCKARCPHSITKCVSEMPSNVMTKMYIYAYAWHFQSHRAPTVGFVI